MTQSNMEKYIMTQSNMEKYIMTNKEKVIIKSIYNETRSDNYNNNRLLIIFEQFNTLSVLKKYHLLKTIKVLENNILDTIIRKNKSESSSMMFIRIVKSTMNSIQNDSKITQRSIEVVVKGTLDEAFTRNVECWVNEGEVESLQEYLNYWRNL